MVDKQQIAKIADAVTGVNVRISDNVIQAMAILVCLVLGAAVGALAYRQRLPAALAGGFLGVIVGLFGSGIGLMIFRAIRHVRGRHD